MKNEKRLDVILICYFSNKYVEVFDSIEDNRIQETIYAKLL